MDVAGKTDLPHLTGYAVKGIGSEVGAPPFEQAPVEDIEPGGDGSGRGTTDAGVALDDVKALSIVNDHLQDDGAAQPQLLQRRRRGRLDIGILERGRDL